MTINKKCKCKTVITEGLEVKKDVRKEELNEKKKYVRNRNKEEAKRSRRG